MAIQNTKRQEDLRNICNDLRSFHKSGLLFSSHRKRMIEHYPEEWVAVYDGQIKAHHSNYKLVLSKIDEMGIPRELTLIRYITKKESSMIL